MKALARRYNLQKRREIEEEEEKKERKNKELFYEAHAVAPSPSRDYYVLKVYQNKFLYTWWKITHGPQYPAPIQRKITLKDFSRDLTIQSELTNIFGERTTDLLHDIANEKWLLSTMPSNILRKIISFLSVHEILTLSKVCTRLYKECSRNDLWQGLCKKHWKLLTVNDEEKSSLIGWKRLYFEKMHCLKPVPASSHTKTNAVWNRVSCATTLNSPASRTSTKSTFTIRKGRTQVLKKLDSLRTTSEMFNATSTSTAERSTERTSKGKILYRNTDWRPMSTIKPAITPRSSAEPRYPRQSSRSVGSFLPSVENAREVDPGKHTDSAGMPKRKFTSVRTRLITSLPSQPPTVRTNKPKPFGNFL